MPRREASPERAPRYDRIGRGYSATRSEDPRIAARIWEALAEAGSVANIGAGTGSYEPRDRTVVAVEPSTVMIAQRPPEAPPVLEGVAERIPLPNASVDAAMAVLADHHWDDPAAGLAEMRRIAHDRVVALTLDYEAGDGHWLLRDYLPDYWPLRPGCGRNLYSLAVEQQASIQIVPVPWDCRDGFLLAFWRRPCAYLDPAVRAGISFFHLIDPADLHAAMARLATDIASGAWQERNADLLALDEIDLGLRLVIWEEPAS